MRILAVTVLLGRQQLCNHVTLQPRINYLQVAKSNLQPVFAIVTLIDPREKLNIQGFVIIN
jgi:hypothetical protein